MNIIEDQIGSMSSMSKIEDIEAFKESLNVPKGYRFNYFHILAAPHLSPFTKEECEKLLILFGSKGVQDKHGSLLSDDLVKDIKLTLSEIDLSDKSSS